MREVFDYIQSMDGPTLNMIDVGCNNGVFQTWVKDNIWKKTYWVGIDAVMHKDLDQSKYDEVFELAIDDVEFPEQQIFHVNIDSGCSSLLRIRSEIITHDASEANNPEKWYIDRDIETIIEERPVTVTSLKRVLDTLPKFQNELIHFLKVDVQGADLRAVRSMREYLDKTVFIQMETVTGTDPNRVLYEGQNLIEEDIKGMDELGFKIYHIFDYDDRNGQETDMYFVNKNYIE